jgi:hypothetical protein
MRGTGVTQAGEQAVFQGIREVCAVRGVWSVSAISVSLSAPTFVKKRCPASMFTTNTIRRSGSKLWS